MPTHGVNAGDAASVVDLRRKLGLAFEARQGVGVAAVELVKDLEGYADAALQIVGSVDDAHATLAQGPFNSEAAVNDGADSERR